MKRRILEPDSPIQYAPMPILTESYLLSIHTFSLLQSSRVVDIFPLRNTSIIIFCALHHLRKNIHVFMK